MKLLNCPTILLAIVCYWSPFIVTGERVIDPNTRLARDVSANGEQYWNNVTQAFDRYIRTKSWEVYREWNRAIVRGDLRNKVSQKCLDVLEYVIRHPVDQEWTAKIIDSMSALPTGIISGTTTELGDYDQCLSVDATYGGSHFVGKYCLATVNLPRTNQFEPISMNRSNLKYAWLGDRLEKWHNNDNFYSVASAVCFPSICHQDEIRDVLLAYYQVLESFEFNVTYCQSREEEPQYDPRIWIALAIFAIPWFLVVPATIFEYLCGCSASDSTFGQILLSFSALSNTRILFRMVDSKSLTNAQFQFVHGIRALAAIFIIMAHASGLVFVPYHMRVAVFARHPTDLIDISRTPIAQPFYNGALVVLTFFLISGMFLTYWTASDKKLKIGFLSYSILRWLRYTPPLIGMLCLTVCLEFLGNGPVFHHDLLWPHVEPCYNDWLSHLFFYSNYRDIDKTCGIQTWYIAVEMQLHLLAFLFLLAYVRSKRLAMWIAVFFIALGMGLIVTFVASGLASIPLVHVTMYTQFEPTHSAVRYIFFAPTMNMIPYFLGVLLGKMLLENRLVTFRKSTTRIIWACSALIILALPMSSLPNADNLDLIPGDKTVANAIAFAIVVLLWSLANGWIVYQCATNPQNGLNRVLSAKMFQPISRLSFCLYLCHLMTIWYNTHQTRTTISVASMNELYKYVSLTVVQAFILAYILYISFEAPSVNLIKLLMKREMKIKADKKALAEQNEVNNNDVSMESLETKLEDSADDDSSELKSNGLKEDEVLIEN